MLFLPLSETERDGKQTGEMNHSFNGCVTRDSKN